MSAELELVHFRICVYREGTSPRDSFPVSLSLCVPFRESDALLTDLPQQVTCPECLELYRRVFR